MLRAEGCLCLPYAGPSLVPRSDELGGLVAGTGVLGTGTGVMIFFLPIFVFLIPITCLSMQTWLALQVLCVL